MKTRGLALCLLLLLAVLLFTGNRITERILDQQLGPLLTEQLGLPVSLAPIDADLLTLTARTAQLVMGDPSAPAIDARQVMVSLDWGDLVRGEVRLIKAAGQDLTVQLSNWPGNDDPWPTDYFFLDPWLPEELALDSGRYIDAEGNTWPLRKGRWFRAGKGARLVWTEDRAEGAVHISTGLKSLADLLGMRRLDLEIDLKVPETPSTTLQLSIEPATDSGYALQANGKLAGMALKLSAGNSESWRFPSQSRTEIDRLVPANITALLDGLDRDLADRDLEALLESPVPRYALPTHEARVDIDDIQVDDEHLRDTVFTLAVSPDGYRLDSLESQGPAGTLRGDAAMHQEDENWELKVDATIKARDADDRLLSQYLEADWHWRDGRAEMSGTGKTWGEIVDSLKGYVTLAGFHDGAVQTPLNIDARLDTNGDSLRLESLEVRSGDAVVTGSLDFSGGKQRKLTLNLDGEDLDLNFLFDEPDAESAPGIAVPEFLALFPGIEVSWVVTARNLRLPNMYLGTANISIDRGVDRGRVIARATGTKGGEMGMKLSWEPAPEDGSNVHMAVDLDQVDLERLFDQRTGLLESKTTGNVVLSSRGSDIAEIFKAMRGDADLTLTLISRPEGADQAGFDQDIRLTGAANLVIDQDRILGLKIDQLDIDAVEQDLTGELTMAVGQSPWFIANLSSRRFSVSRIMEWLPDTAEEADQANILLSLRELGDARISFKVEEIEVAGVILQEVSTEIVSGKDFFNLGKLDFTYEQGKFKSKAGITWEDEQAALQAEGNVVGLVLDHFLAPKNLEDEVPLAGSFELDGQGTSFAKILASLNGQVSLQPESPQPPERRRLLDVELKRLPNGVDAQVKTLAWGKSELQGHLVYQNEDTPLWDVEITGGDLSLIPWEDAMEEETTEDPDEEKSTLGRAASTSAGFVGNLLTAPARMLTGDSEGPSSETRFFSEEPIDISFLHRNNGNFRVKLDSLTSQAGFARDLDIGMNLKDAMLRLSVTADEFNGGKADFKIDVDAAGEIPVGDLSATFTDVYRLREQTSYPRSGHIEFQSKGLNAAELAANLNGQVYIEFGRGPMDYQGLAFLTADVGASMFRALIPGTETRQPEMRCAVAIGEFKDGVGITPYGYAARTRTANLIGRIEVDFRKEKLKIQFDSRNRGGSGLAVGNVFSNTVRIEGPMTDPAIVPNTTGLLWRGWAAFMTAGLSVIGESMVKRVLAADDPCGDLLKEMQKNVCGTGQPLSASPMVCPAERIAGS